MTISTKSELFSWRFIVWQELVRMAVTWGVMIGLTAFFYWMLSNIGTF